MPESESQFPASGGIRESSSLWTVPLSNERSRLSASESRRLKHPLLKALEGFENDVKHSDYTVHVLIERQTREYANAVKDVLKVLKNCSETVTKCENTWRGEDLNKTDYWISDHLEEELEVDLTDIARKIIKISEAVKSINEEDNLAFWTSQQHVMMLQHLVSFAKEMVKLRRKLDRMKGSLEDRVRNVRRVAIKCECEITNNLVPPDIYYQWVKEDSNLCKISTSEKVNASLQDISKFKGKMRTLKKTAKSFIVSCLNSTDSEPESSIAESAINSLTSSTSTDQGQPSSPPVRVYQMDKKIETLHQIDTVTEQDYKSICECELSSLQVSTAGIDSNNINNKSDAPSPAPLPEDVWVAKPSQKCLDMISSNMALPNKFSIRESHCKSHVNDQDKADHVLAVTDTMLNVSLNANTLADDNEPNPHHIIEEYLPPSFTTDSINGSNSDITASPSNGDILSGSMKQQMSLILNSTNAMQEVISHTTGVIRGMERKWVSPETMEFSKSSGREFFQLIDFIVETAKLTEDPAFAARLYPEDKHEIISVLDPVLRELTNFFMCLHTLHGLVAVDVHYLKQLISAFPKGSLRVSDCSIDEELPKAKLSNDNNDVDMDQLFE